MQRSLRDLRLIRRVGGQKFGTLDELFEAVTLVQTGKIDWFPIALVGRDYWAPLVGWLNDTLAEQGMINVGDTDYFKVVDTAEEATAHIWDSIDGMHNGADKS